LENNNFVIKSISCKQYDYDEKQMLFFGDGGVDLFVSYFEMDVFIQCKSLAKKIGPSVVRQLNGIKRNNIVNCLTNENGYSAIAITEAKHYNILLTNKKNISETLINYYNNVFKKKNNVKIEYKIDSIESLIINDNFILKNIKGCTINVLK
jgi:Restriction endonuclease